GESRFCDHPASTGRAALCENKSWYGLGVAVCLGSLQPSFPVNETKCCGCIAFGRAYEAYRMSKKTMVILDGNEAAASVAYRLSEIVAIYPITPSSPMAEWADQWLSEGKRNIWGALPIVEELQSEGGAA